MFKSYHGCLFAALFSISCSVQAAEPVFKGAIGFGVNTPAGQVGQVIKVTNLDPNGPGSFTEALMAKGPRIVVFEIGGIIDINLMTIRIVEPYLTVAGQTAPSPGITLIRGGMQIRTHDVLFQHIRIRTGDVEKKRVPWDIDALTTVGGEAYNIVIDHCSFSWAVDENLSVAGPSQGQGPEITSHLVTLSNNIVSEGLYNSIHHLSQRRGDAWRPHSMGSLIGSFCHKISFIRNIYANNNMRNPNFTPSTTGIVVNNLIYNPGIHCIHTHGKSGDADKNGPAFYASEWAIVGNYIIAGPNTTIPALIESESKGRLTPVLYIKDNQCSADSIPMKTGSITEVNQPPVWPDGMVVLPTSEIYDELIAHSGARPADRDAVDIRIINEIKTRTGKIINSQTEVGGYPTAVPTQRTLQVPQDPNQIPAWLERYAAEVEGR